MVILCGISSPATDELPSDCLSQLITNTLANKGAFGIQSKIRSTPTLSHVCLVGFPNPLRFFTSEMTKSIILEKAKWAARLRNVNSHQVKYQISTLVTCAVKLDRRTRHRKAFVMNLLKLYSRFEWGFEPKICSCPHSGPLRADITTLDRSLCHNTTIFKYIADKY